MKATPIKKASTCTLAGQKGDTNLIKLESKGYCTNTTWFDTRGQDQVVASFIFRFSSHLWMFFVIINQFLLSVSSFSLFIFVCLCYNFLNFMGAYSDTA